MDDLIADFVAECREMLEALGGEIVAWEAQPDDRARLDSIFRFVHTVKGNCGFFDFPRLEALSHAAEDALADVRANRRNPDATLVSGVLSIIDRIGEMIGAIEAGEDCPPGRQQLDRRSGAGAEGPPSGRDQPSPRAKGTVASSPRTIRLSVELLDRVMSGVSDMVLARNELARRLRETRPTSRRRRFRALSGSSPKCATPSPARACSASRICSSPCRAWSATCRRSWQAGAGRHRRRRRRARPRDDRDDPRSLTHIIRNAVDHGIETPGRPPEERQARDRPAVRLGAPVRQPDPDRHRRRRPRHRRQEAGRESHASGASTRRRRRAGARASSWR
jgi:two-component system chemotaxis sensor kinase CheA